MGERLQFPPNDYGHSGRPDEINQRAEADQRAAREAAEEAALHRKHASSKPLNPTETKPPTIDARSNAEMGDLEERKHTLDDY